VSVSHKTISLRSGSSTVSVPSISIPVLRSCEHGHGIALLHARTEAGWFEPIWQHARAILFMADRIKFCRPDGFQQPANSGAPPCLIAFGSEALSRLQRCGLGGALVTGWQVQPATDQAARQHTDLVELVDAWSKE
jgi:hypothetical protein